ncbi:MAG: universal stress protein [Anaerolineales bacterium]|nr:universal stress protein [Anaerolineales bacterium]
MGLILCATRGGEASIHAQDLAISLADKENEPLVFIYIADDSFLNKTAAAVVVDVQNELVNMGEFFLVMAVERAVNKGVEASAITRVGPFRATLCEAAGELGATTIVLGQPSGETSHFQEEEFQHLLECLAEETGAEIVTP